MTPATSPTQQLSPAELAEARAALEAARDRVYSATANLSATQWNYPPAPERWSIAQIVEHMVTVQELVLGPIAHALSGTPETDSTDTAAIDEIVKTQVAVRTGRFNAPPAIQPTGKWTPRESLDRLAANTERLVEAAGATPGLRKHRLPSPPLKAISGGKYELMDGYQWILTAAFHTDRHTEQIQEVKAAPGFPE